MAFTPPTNEPQELVAGDRWQWERSLNDYPADTWTLSYSMHALSATAAKQTITATQKAGTNDHEVDVAAATTAAYAAGDYEWYAFVTDGTTRRRVDHGTLKILPDLEADSATDRRSHWHIVLDNIEAVIQDRATKDQASYSINGRQLSRLSPSELIELHDRAKAEVLKAERRDRARNGQGHKGRVLVRL